MESIRASRNRVVNSVNLEGQYNTAITNNYGTNYFQSAPQFNGSGLSYLKARVAFNALHNSEARYPQPNVLPGTRKEILQRLSSWCEQPSKENRVFWVSGAAGVGKSAIAQSLSEKYTQSGQLAAAFFFSRNDPTRDKLDPFVTTILYQLATSQVLNPLIVPLIDNIIGSTPGILHQTWETQFQTLIIDALAQVDPRSWSQLPQLVIIDGVDECIKVHSQKRLLNMIQAGTSILPLDFLVFSRPEPHISNTFHHKSFTPAPFCLNLGNFTESVRKDIKAFLQHQFASIREAYGKDLPHSWPDNSMIAELLDRATGQFIYATTVMKFIKYGKLPLTPMQRLDVILCTKRMANSSSPYPDLDLLYLQILQFCLNEDRKLQQILRLIVSPFGHYTHLSSNFERYLQLDGSPHSVGYTSVWALEHILELSQGEASALLSGLHSILDIPAIQTENIVVLHASFSEFLLDSDRAGMFYVGTKLSTAEWKKLILACQIRILSQICVQSEQWLKELNDNSTNGVFNTDIGSLNVWMALEASTAINDKIVAALNKFDPYLYLTTLLHWRYRHTYSATLENSYKVSQHVPRDDLYSLDLQNSLLMVCTHICKLYNVFLLLEKTSEHSSHLHPFFERCRTFFQGFNVSFPPGQNKIFSQYILLACQLSLSCLSCPDGTFAWSKWTLFTWIGLLSTGASYSQFLASASFTVTGPLHNIDGQPSTISEGWNTVYISSTEAQLLYRLLKCLSSSQRRHIEEVLTSYEMQEWAYRLAQLEWRKTTKTFLKARISQILHHCLARTKPGRG